MALDRIYKKLDLDLGNSLWGIGYLRWLLFVYQYVLAGIIGKGALKKLG
jgi:hypothetical protein